jgi:hypothetical protein
LPANASNPPALDPECKKALDHCGMALAELVRAGTRDTRPFDEDPEPASFKTGGACLENGKLLVDVDGDGRPEVFSAADFVDNFRAPADEVMSSGSLETDCQRRFAIVGVVPAGDPRDWRGLDLLGVIDLDDDGRPELVLAYHYADRYTWAVYSPRRSAAGLELVAEGVPWQPGE